MTTTTTTPTTEAAPLPSVATPPKAKRQRKQAAPSSAPVAPVNAERQALLAEVKAIIASAKGQPLNLAVPLLEKGLAIVHAKVPAPDFATLGLEGNEHKAERTKMLQEMREKRANLGFQVAARMLNDAISATNGCDQQRRYGVRQLVNGGIVATENIRSTLRTQKQRVGISIR